VGTEWQPKTTVPVSGDDAEKLEKLANALEDHDDVQTIYTNAE